MQVTAKPAMVTRRTSPPWPAEQSANPPPGLPRLRAGTRPAFLHAGERPCAEGVTPRGRERGSLGEGSLGYTARVRIRVLSVGRDRSGLYEPAVQEYAGRIERYVRFALEEVPEARRAAGTPRAREEEGELLLARIRDVERVVALDEGGKAHSSLEFARSVGTWLQGGRDVTLVIGGSDGLSGAVRERAGDTVSLSRLTLAHRLARLVLVEQIYRAFTILRGEPYHK